MNLHRYFDVSHATSLAAFEARLIQFAHELEFPLINAVMVIEPSESRAPPQFLSVGNTPAAFFEASKDVADSRRDPVNRLLKRLSIPFIYDQKLYTSEAAGDLWETQAAFGYKTGVMCALHLPGHKHFLLGIDRDKPLPRSEQRLSRLMADLQLLAVHAQSAAIRLLVPADDATAMPELNARELDVLRWSLEGKTAWEAGQILGITEHTVNFHLRNIFRKLNVSTKQHAVVKALNLGLLRA